MHAHLRALAERAGGDEEAHGGPLLGQQRHVQRPPVVRVLLGHACGRPRPAARGLVREQDLHACIWTSRAQLLDRSIFKNSYTYSTHNNTSVMILPNA